MAVSSVKIASIIGMKSDLDKVIKVCGESGIFHPDNALKFYDNTEGFESIAEKKPYSAFLQTLKECLESSNKPIKLVDVSKFNVTEKEIKQYIDYLSEKLGVFLQAKKELTDKIDKYQKTINEISHFLGLSLDLEKVFSCEYVKPHFGSIPKDSYEKICSYDENPYVLFFPCTSDELYYWGVYFAPLDSDKEVCDIFSSFYFKEVTLNIKDSTPEAYVAKLNGLIEENLKLLDVVNNKIEAFWKVQYNQCIRFYSKIDELNTYFSIKQYVFSYNNSFILLGWIPAEKEYEFTDKLDSLNSIEYSIEDAREGLKFSPPVRLRNKKLFKPFELFIDMYGLPCYDEVDPTVFVAIIYTLLYGIMFGDFGQGLVLALGGFLAWKFKKMKLGKILIPCGISSAIFGLIFGSAFGFEHALDPFYNKVFGLKEKPIDVMESHMTTNIIYSAVGIGIVLILVAMLMNIYSSLKRKNFGRAIFGPNGIAGFILYGSAMFGMVSTLALKMNIVNGFYIVFLIIVPLISIMFNEVLGKLVAKDPNWKPENPGEYIIQNVFELFETVLSYITNTMSFLRVGVFILVHAGMMMVVFILAEMFSGAGYVLIVIVGNIFVMCLEGLLVGIQVLRLNFYEMFSRFFDGDGRAFEPVLSRSSSN